MYGKALPVGVDWGSFSVEKSATFQQFLSLIHISDVPVQNFLRFQLVKIIQLDLFSSSCLCKVSRSFSSMVSICRCLNWQLALLARKHVYKSQTRNCPFTRFTSAESTTRWLP